eukprot:TRINITY_DN27379_c0_g1_i1.p1 TRINITY_DN27379_c0_g1~~TRINITY_DN27379_c0_g1_i1.p1  ORF type:complete len:661 (+),score=177.56 TRINITY_DN27379_c0_g1_i1:81-2063(+)
MMVDGANGPPPTAPPPGGSVGKENRYEPGAPPAQASNMAQMQEEHAAVGVPEEDGPVPMARDDYPNPCGRCADVGRWRDFWFTLLWIGACVFLIVVGVTKHSSKNVYAPCKGVTTLSVESSDWEWNESDNATRKTYDSTADCHLFMEASDYMINLACDEDFLFVLLVPKQDPGGEIMSIDRCNDIHDRHSVRLDPTTLPFSKHRSFPQTLALSKDFAEDYHLKSITVHESSCELYSSAMSMVMWGLGIKAAAISFALSLLFIIMSRLFPETAIKVLGVVFVCYTIGMSLYAVHRDIWWLMVVCLVVGALTALVLSCTWENIPFAALCLKASAAVVVKHWGLIVAAFLTFGLVLCAVVFFVLAVGTKDELVAVNGIFWPLLLALLWTEEVLSNLAHVTAVGSVADWFYSEGGAATPRLFAKGASGYPTAGSFRRAVTWGMGSVCLGSTLVTPVKWVRWFFKTLHDALGPAGCVCKPCLVCFDSAMRVFNDYGFVHVGVYGKPYITAAKQSWDSLRYGTAWDLIIRDSLLNSVFFIYILLGTFGTTSLCFFLDFCPEETCQENMGIMLSGLVAGVVQLVMTRLLYSGTLTIFVCYADLKKLGFEWQPPGTKMTNPLPLQSALVTKYQQYQLLAETPNPKDPTPAPEPQPQGVGPHGDTIEMS